VLKVYSIAFSARAHSSPNNFDYQTEIGNIKLLNSLHIHSDPRFSNEFRTETNQKAPGRCKARSEKDILSKAAEKLQEEFSI
jgi:hypothetical protein